MELEQEGQTVRYPSTANLMVDSNDKVSGNTGNFLISKNEAILNGYFTRLSVSEVVLDWFEPNFTGGVINYTVTANGSYTQSGSVTIPSGNYNMTVQQVINCFTGAMNTVTGTTGLAFATANLTNSIQGNPTSVITLSGPLSGKTTVNLSLSNGSTAGTPQSTSIARLLTQPLWFYSSAYNTAYGAINVATALLLVYNPAVDFRPTDYIDIVSTSLTYNQRVKDGSTAETDRTVLCRWYFSYDNPPTYDGLNYPILMGYLTFSLRRLFNTPKQIRWTGNQPIGQLSFQVYNDTGNLFVPISVYPSNGSLTNVNDTNYRITLQASEN